MRGGGVYVGQAGDARGTKALRDEDGATARSALDAYRAEVEQEQQRSGKADVFVGSVVPTSLPPSTPTPPPSDPPTSSNVSNGKQFLARNAASAALSAPNRVSMARTF